MQRCANMRLRFLLTKWIVLMAVAVLCTAALNPIVRGQQPVTLRKIEVLGLKRLQPDKVIQTSGLQLGQRIDNAMVDEAATKLIQAGLFKTVSYKMRTTDKDAIIIFEVEESIKNLPVVFENFVWFTDEEIVRAIRQDVPFYDGTAPEAGVTSTKISAALQRLLNQKQIGGQVDFMPYGDTATGKQELLYTVKGVKLPVCELRFPGTQDISEAELIKNSQPLIQADYSRKNIAGFAHYTLFPLYRRIGHLRARFEDAKATLDSNATGACRNGVSVTIPVDEGLVYSWNDAEWTGNEVLPAAELADALAMKTGEVADGLKIDSGVKAVRRAYGRKGYLGVRMKDAITFDDATRGVTYQFTINEGPQFRMGNLIINGLAPGDTQSVKEKWTLAPGAVYDESYLDDFRTNNREFLAALYQRLRGTLQGRTSTEIKPDAQKQTVDVVITFK
jgi:outer membrane protein insertion porin family